MKTKFTFIRVLFNFCLISFLPFVSLAQEGSLDSSFNTTGKVITTVGTFTDSAAAIAVIEDPMNPNNANFRRIIAAGSTHNNSNHDILISRYNNNGSLDNTFGNNGIVTTDIGNKDNIAKAIAIQSDGKIVVAATNDNFGTGGKFAIVRYNSNGTLDTTFNTTGIAIITLGAVSAEPASVAIQSDGKIVVAGHSNDGGGKDMDVALIRLYDNGILDNSFGESGIVLTTLGPIGTIDSASEVAIQSDGKIVVSATTYQATNTDFAVLRYTTDGILDTSFSSDGMVITPITGAFNEICTALRIQNDGKILISGGSNSNFDDFILVRYDSDGNYDGLFGTNGIVKTDLDFGVSTDEGTPTALCIQNDNKILAVGYGTNGIALNFIVARYNENGLLDSTFGDNGIVVTDFGSSDDTANCATIQNDGKILAAGGSHDGTQGRLAIARYNNASNTLTRNSIKNSTSKISIAPNPFSTFTNLFLENTLEKATLNIYNNNGQLVKQKSNISGKKIVIDRENLSTGVYFIEIIEKNHPTLKTKIVISE